MVKNGRTVLSNVISSQIALHTLYGGVVPEIASRMHIEAIYALADQALQKAQLTREQIDAIAVTYAPGLIGAVLVGVNFAKAAALALDKPLIPVHHIRGHIAANYIAYPELKPPFLCLVVSGGHTMIVDVQDYTKMEILGTTLDDAAGECFDKSARVMGLAYQGGVTLDKIATTPDFKKYPLPIPRVQGSEYDFSFSGLKTAVINLIHNATQKGEEVDVPVLAATLRARVSDMLVENTMKAAEKLGYNKIALAGGVSANSELRARMKSECEKRGIKLYYPELKYCGDNAAMVASQGYYEFLAGNRASMDLNACAQRSIDIG